MTVLIVTPAFNAAETIAETIDSVRAQSWKDWIYRVVDDGSSDDTAAVVERYRDDPRIELIRQENGGVSAAINRGLEPVTADFMALLGSDDIWEPEYLSTMVESLESHPEWGLAWCELQCFGDRTGLYRGDREPVAGEAAATLPRIFSDVTFLGSGVVCRASFFRDGLRFPEEFRVMEDVHVWAAIAVQSSIGHVPRPLVRYRVHQRSLSTSAGSMLRNYATNLASYGRLYRDYRSWIPQRLYRQKMWWIHHYAADALLQQGRRGIGPTLAALFYGPCASATWKNLVKGLSPRRRTLLSPFPQGGPLS